MNENKCGFRPPLCFVVFALWLGGGVGLNYSNSKANLIYTWIAKSCSGS